MNYCHLINRSLSPHDISLYDNGPEAHFRRPSRRFAAVEGRDLRAGELKTNQKSEERTPSELILRGLIVSRLLRIKGFMLGSQSRRLSYG